MLRSCEVGGCLPKNILMTIYEQMRQDGCSFLVEGFGTKSEKNNESFNEGLIEPTEDERKIFKVVA